MVTKEDVIMILGTFICLEEEEQNEMEEYRVKQRKRRKGPKLNTYRDRHFLTQGQHLDTLNHLHMDISAYNEILQRIGPKIQKQTTAMRSAINPEDRLNATLRFLALGGVVADLKYSCGMSPQLLVRLIPETCMEIYKELMEDYIHLPESSDEWKNIAQDFSSKWQFENCLGSIDGRHIELKNTSKATSYQGLYSVVLLALVNANYEFMYIHTGTNGKKPDKDVLESTDFHDNLINGRLNLPAPRKMPGIATPLPYVFLGSDAFSLRDYLMKPFSQENLQPDQEVFNYRLCRARQVAENAFEILLSHFHVLSDQLSVSLKTVDAILLACCTLHNFLIRKCPNYLNQSIGKGDISSNTVIEGKCQKESKQLLGLERVVETDHQVDERARGVRDLYKFYYNNPGSVDF